MLKLEPNNGASLTTPRHTESQRRRKLAAQIAETRIPQVTRNNGEIGLFGNAYPTNFHKGIPHNKYGLPDPTAFANFISALNGDDYADLCAHADFNVAIGPKDANGMWAGTRDEDFKAETTFYSKLEKPNAQGKKEVRPPKVRNWESPLGGHQFDLMGPDAGDLAMMPAPALASSELTAELAEVYVMALLRDVSFKQIDKEPERQVIADAFDGGDYSPPTVASLIGGLNQLKWFNGNTAEAPAYYLIAADKASTHEQRRRQARWIEGGSEALSAENLFRGSVPGAKVGPYVSQLLLIGSKIDGDPDIESDATDAATPTQWQPSKAVRHVQAQTTPASEESSAGVRSGYISFGAQRIDQRVKVHKAGRDYMTDWPLWLDVQNGADVTGADVNEDELRFIGTPRDLATFVHFDQLYQAYFNACLLLFTNKVPFDFGFPSGGAHATRGSFATFGGPHVLSLMTEVASRALKAVRRQKFQHHLRCRPEQLAAMLTLEANDHGAQLGTMAQPGFTAMLAKLESEVAASTADGMGTRATILQAITALNKHQNKEVADSAAPDKETLYPRRVEAADIESNDWKDADEWKNEELVLASDKNYLLPMAFPEGSPMHAAYGAGHATVAGACVTILKAFFEMSLEDVPRAAGSAEPTASIEQPLSILEIKTNSACWKAATFKQWFGYEEAFVANDGTNRTDLTPAGFPTTSLTVEGELNKLAANISIGRNFAGVHFYTDYYDSLRMGERLAVGLLQEQMTTYRDPVSMRFKSFDNDRILIYGDGCGGTRVEVCEANSDVWIDAYAKGGWWDRHTTIEPA